MSDLTGLLTAVEAGDAQAADRLLPLVYDELRELASRHLKREKPGQTLQATALVHEAYLRLVGGGRAGKGEESPRTGAATFTQRRHFFAAAGEAMRRILIENARRKKRRKRGAGWIRREIDDLDLAAEHEPDDVLDLDDALTQLAASDPAAAQLVQLRFFAGLPLAEVARLLEISPRSADRLWAYARAWLHQKIASRPERQGRP